jgi:hypothetical protein
LPPSTFQSGEGYCPQLLAHEVVLVKFELQTHTEHLSSCRSGFLVVFVLLNFTFLCIRNFLLAIKYENLQLFTRQTESYTFIVKYS